MSATTESLEQKLKSWKNPVEMLQNAKTGPYIFPISPEFTNWRDEQEAWYKTAVLFDLSKHMTDIYFEGPDLMPLLSDLAVNSFAGVRLDPLTDARLIHRFDESLPGMAAGR